MSASTSAQRTSSRYRVLLWPAAIVLLYVFYVNGLGTNPPGFYLDESVLSYNAYQISQTGRNEHGETLPLYFPIFRKDDGTFDGYANPTYIYALAALHFVFPPSVLLSRLFSATIVFLASVLLALLAARISRRRSVGAVVGLTALLTPWLFELSRLVFEATLYPLALVLFLSALYRAHLKERWSLLDSAMVAVTLALVTYTYTIGRLFGPLLALGLLAFATDARRLKDVVKVWFCYGLTMLPFFVYVLRHPGTLSQRFGSLTYVTPNKSPWQIAAEFINAYLADVGPKNLLLAGDPLLRHHVPGMGMVFAATCVLAVAGLVVVLARHRRDPWWRFVLFGLVVSVLPGALTVQRFHMLRLIAFPVFLILLTVPALMWLLEDAKGADGESISARRKRPARFALGTRAAFGLSLRVFTPDWPLATLAGRSVRRPVLFVLLALTLLQAALFQAQFRSVGPTRGYLFDDAYPKILEEALATPARPLYLADGFWGPAYIHAYYYANVRGLDTSQFVHLTGGARPPSGALVLSSDQQCTDCEMVSRRGSYILFRAR